MALLIGRTFVNPLVDYLVVGGGLTLPIFAALYFSPGLNPIGGGISEWTFIAINGAHFAASTIRLYTKPGARQEFPFLSWVFPGLCLALVAAGLYWPRVGGQIKALYFTWSPFHYAAQTYGLAVMYAMRSGARLDGRDKAHIRGVCLLPFVYSFFTTPMGGSSWFISPDTVAASVFLSTLHETIVVLLRAAVLLLPVSLFWQMHRMRGRQVPLIVLVLQISNGVWWLGSDFLNAWFWTAVLHSLQYLVVVTVRHVDERTAASGVRNSLRATLFHGTAFYGFSLVVGFVLFFVAPSAFVMLGLGTGVEAYAMMTLVINLHHFIVDGFIWRNRPARLDNRVPQPLAAAA